VALVTWCAVAACRVVAAEGDDEPTTQSWETTTPFEETTTLMSHEPAEPTKSPVEIAIAKVANVTNALLPALFYVSSSQNSRHSFQRTISGE